MAIADRQRFCGVEDEFRVTSPRGHFVPTEELFSRAQRFFFDESGHVPIFEPVRDRVTEGGRTWTWYGGAFYNDYDSTGTLVEAATPLTPFDRGIEALVDNVLTQRAQLVELSKGDDVAGVSTHLNLLLDSIFQERDLCEFKARVPSNAFGHVEAQKLGADVALIATHTISPVISYLLFNHKPAKGALYRPRRHRRMEMCLPYVPEPDQMRVGFLFWFAAVDYITDLIKTDLGAHQGWTERYQDQDYYKLILAKFPFIVSNVRFQRPSYYLGYQLQAGVEDNVMENGSQAVVKTEGGNINIIELTKAYVEFFSRKLFSMASKSQLVLLEDFLAGRRKLNVDVMEVPKSSHLDQTYIVEATGKSPSRYLNEHEVDEVASIHLKFLRRPLRVLKPPSSVLPERVIRNLGQELQWDFISLELAEETENVVRQYLLEVPLHQTDDYLRLEENFTKLDVFLDSVSLWLKASSEIPNPGSVFAYGTLMNPDKDRRGFGAVVTSVQKGRVYGEAYDFGDYPVLIESYETSLVPGVLLSILNFEEAVNKFDFYEGCHNPNPIFVRALRQVLLENLESILSWVYIGNRNNRLVREKLKRAPRLSGLWAKASVRLASEAGSQTGI